MLTNDEPNVIEMYQSIVHFYRANKIVFYINQKNKKFASKSELQMPINKIVPTDFRYVE